MRNQIVMQDKIMQSEMKDNGTFPPLKVLKSSKKRYPTRKETLCGESISASGSVRRDAGQLGATKRNTACDDVANK